MNEDKAGLETEVQRLLDQIKDLSDKNKMQLEQVNGLLLEKVNMQSDGLDQRDRMLQRERDIGYVSGIQTFEVCLCRAIAISERRSQGRIPRISRHVYSNCMKNISCFRRRIRRHRTS